MKWIVNFTIDYQAGLQINNILPKDKVVFDFLNKSLIRDVFDFEFNFMSKNQISMKYYMKSLTKFLPKVSKSLRIYSWNFESKQFSKLITASSHLYQIVFYNCDITLEKCKFPKEIRYKIKTLQFRKIRSDDFFTDKKWLDQFISLISESSLAKSLERIRFYQAQITQNDINEIMKKYPNCQNISCYAFKR